jgi:hypothetical protein
MVFVIQHNSKSLQANYGEGWLLMSLLCLLKYLKLVEMTIVMVFSNVEDERIFFTMSFMKFKFHY